MRGFLGFTKRNLMLYFKDKQNIFFSLMTSIIVLVLYLLFLKGTFVDAIERSMRGLEQLVDTADVEMLANGILLVGVLGSAMITVPYNCLSFMVNDKERKIDYDISATPLKRWQIILAYFCSAVITSFIMTALILSAGLLMLRTMGDMNLSLQSYVCCYGAVLLGDVSSTALFMLVMLMFKTTAASSAFSGLLSAAAGFVIGAYIPIAQFSDAVQTVCNLFPATNVVVLYRNLLLNGILDRLNTSIGGIDQGMFVEGIKGSFSFNTRLFGESLTLSNSALYVCGATVICLVLVVALYAKNYKRK